MGKSFEQFLHLDEAEYRRDISSLDETELTRLHRITQQKCVAASAGAGASLASTFFTGPIGVFGAAVSARRINVNNRRVAIIDERLKEKGWGGYTLRKRDLFTPVAITSAVAFVAPGADAVVGHFAGHAATHAAANLHAATSAAAHHGATAAGQIAEHPETFAKAVEQGALGQLNELTHGVVGHAAHAAPVTTLAAHNADALGIAAGEIAAKAGEVKLVKLATETVTELTVTKVTERLSTNTTKQVAAIKVTGVNVEEDKSSDDKSRTKSLELQQACREGREEVVRMLIDHGADVDAGDSDAWKPLHWAARRGHLNVVNVLLAHGANATAKDTIDNRTPLHLAAQYGHSDMVVALAGGGADIEAQLKKTGKNPLHLASGSDHTDVVRTLIRLGANVNARQHNKYTALHVASDRCKVENVRVLLANHADIHAVDKDSWNALHFGCSSVGVIEALLDKSSCLHESRMDNGQTALHRAIALNEDKVVAALLARGADPNQHDGTGWMPLHACVVDKDKNLRIPQLLLDAGAYPSCEDEDGWTPLHFAAACKNTDKSAVITKLLAGGANPNAGKGLKQCTPLHRACVATRSTHVTALLASSRTQINAWDADKWTALHYAAWHGDQGLVSALLKKGADADVTEQLFRRTPLHLAVKAGKPLNVKALLPFTHPGLLQLKDNKGNLPIDLAPEKQRQAMQELLVPTVMKRTS